MRTNTPKTLARGSAGHAQAAGQTGRARSLSETMGGYIRAPPSTRRLTRLEAASPLVRRAITGGGGVEYETGMLQGYQT